MSSKESTGEQELLLAIAEVEQELSNIRLRLSDYKSKLIQTESDLIGSKIAKERLVEQLRRFRLSQVDYSETPREKDIARFRQVLPSLIKEDLPDYEDVQILFKE